MSYNPLTLQQETNVVSVILRSINIVVLQNVITI